MTVFVGADPGETTGIVRWDSAKSSHEIEYLQVPIVSIGPVIRQVITAECQVACERYVIGRNTAKKKRSHAPEVIGMIEQQCDTVQAKLTMQTASDAKSFGVNRTLELIGWKWRGYRHATDAARHMLLLIAKVDPTTFEKLVYDGELNA